MIKKLLRNLSNIPGWRTNRKIVVFESDDWGSVRMPSLEAYNTFLSLGYKVNEDPYCRCDTIANSTDLIRLFEVLSSVKDKFGRNAVLTANTIVANPEFTKIRESGFKEFFYEPFTETLKRSPYDPNAFKLWQEGISSSLFKPQFHGREHLYVKKWMRDLKSGDRITRSAFDLGTFGLPANADSSFHGDYMGAFNSGIEEDIENFKIIINDGLNLFEQIFGYRSLSFIPTTYTWHPNIETELFKNGVRYLQGMIHQRIPIDDDLNFTYKKNNFTGSKSKAGLLYLSRNAFFEPAQNPDCDWVSDCLNRIKIAYFWGKPAIISVHRLNFIGGLIPKNREKNLNLFKELLNKIVKLYPDVEFMSTDELGSFIVNSKQKEN